MALPVGEFFGFQCISVGDIINKEISKKLDIGRKIEKNSKECTLVEDEIVIELLKKELIRLEKENVSYIVEGFPRNRVQSMFLQNCGILPDNIIILSTTEEKTKSRLKEKLQKNFEEDQVEMLVTNAYNQYDLNRKAVMDIYKSYYSEIVTTEKSNSSIIEEIAVF